MEIKNKNIYEISLYQLKKIKKVLDGQAIHVGEFSKNNYMVNIYNFSPSTVAIYRNDNNSKLEIIAKLPVTRGHSELNLKKIAKVKLQKEIANGN